MKFRCVTRPSLRRGYLWKPSERFHKSPFLLVTHNLIEFQDRKRKRSTQKSENFHKVAKIGFDFQSCREWNVTQFFFPVLHRLSREAKSPQANGAVPPPKILLSKKVLKVSPWYIPVLTPRAKRDSTEIQLKFSALEGWSGWRPGGPTYHFFAKGTVK